MKNEAEFVGLVGRRLQKMRIDAGYNSYENFAFEHNLPRVQYWRIENGKANFTIKSLVKILEVHNTSLRDFFLNLWDGK